MNEIVNVENQTMTTQMKEVIKEMYFPKASDAEFAAFLFDAQAKGLDPLQKEIVPISFKGKTTTVVSRDGYVKKAKQNPDFLGYRSQPIYSNDEFTYEEDNEGFKYSFKTKGFGDRGELVGAFCHVKMKGEVEDTFALVSFKEVRLNTPVWKTNPTFMTQKVAEVRALKPICNLSGICSDVELGQNLTADEGTEDEIDSEIKVEKQQTKKEPKTLEPERPKQYKYKNQEDINKYFQAQKNPDGFTKEEVQAELTKLKENEELDPNYYTKLMEYTKNIIAPIYVMEE